VTPLGRLLKTRIAAEGPMRLSDYMAECLLHPDHGYYTGRDPLGAAGDFTTAPEMSQVFGELLGLALAQTWLDQGRHSPFALAELGPGRGTLMADILRATRSVPGFAEAARVVLVEASPRLRAIQAATLGPLPRLQWTGDVADLPDGPLFLVANEFFDALPIRQFLRSGPLWRETVVGLQGDRLVPGLSPPLPVPALDHRLPDTREGDVIELCPALPRIAGGIASRIARHGGAAIVVDYGGWRSLGDTFQAVKGHHTADPFAEPGHADLTVHVDFEALSDAFNANGSIASAMTPQGKFLLRLGLRERAVALAARLTGSALDSHLAAARRLTAPEEMGTLFKVIACVPQGAPLPPGLDPR
jgi:SAM-dependent MidA family methyltransferase